MSTLQKRSLCLSGHRTSLALEPEFWVILEAMARQKSCPLAALIGEIDRHRSNDHPLASCLRVAVLRHITHPNQIGETHFRLPEICAKQEDKKRGA